MTNQVIPAEAVEAAAKFLLDDNPFNDADDLWQVPSIRDHYQSVARGALEAAGLSMVAAAGIHDTGWESCPKRHASQVQHLLDCDPKDVKPFKRHFNVNNYYEVHIDDSKVTVYSECCAETMSDETARALYVELHKIYGAAK